MYNITSITDALLVNLTMSTVGAQVSALKMYTLSELTPAVNLYGGYTVNKHSCTGRPCAWYIWRALNAAAVQLCFQQRTVHMACILSRKSGAQCTDVYIFLCKRTAYGD